MKKITLISLMVIALTSCLILSGCGDETTADMVKRQQNRDRARQKVNEDINKLIVGIYQGTDVNKTADIFLVVESSSLPNAVGPEGVSSVPTSTLVGSLIISPRLSISSDNERVQYSYPFNAGQYDSPTNVGGRLSFQNIESNGSTIESGNCDVDANHILDCKWNTTSLVRFKLKPSSSLALQSLSAESSADIVYRGHNDSFSVMMEFDSGVISRDGSQIPQPTILGHMVFFDKNSTKIAPDENESKAKYGFKSGTYDIPSKKITLTMDDDAQVTLVCTILNGGQSLRCIWNSRLKQVFTVTRTVRR